MFSFVSVDLVHTMSDDQHTSGVTRCSSSTTSILLLLLFLLINILTMSATSTSTSTSATAAAGQGDQDKAPEGVHVPVGWKWCAHHRVCRHSTENKVILNNNFQFQLQKSCLQLILMENITLALECWGLGRPRGGFTVPMYMPQVGSGAATLPHGGASSSLPTMGSSSKSGTQPAFAQGPVLK